MNTTALVLAEVAEGDGYAANLQERLIRRHRRHKTLAKMSVDFHLKRLESRGYVQSKYRGGCRIFTITDLGWAALAVVRGQLSPIIRSQISESETMPTPPPCRPGTVTPAVGEADKQGAGR